MNDDLTSGPKDKLINSILESLDPLLVIWIIYLTSEILVENDLDYLDPGTLLRNRHGVKCTSRQRYSIFFLHECLTSLAKNHV